jgi:uncharacterized membrane protein
MALPTASATAELRESWIWQRHTQNLPASLQITGYACAYLPILIVAVLRRKQRALPMVGAAIWIFVLVIAGRRDNMESNPWLYLWVALGACALCYWGVRENRKLFINYGTVIFALDLIAFYFSNVLDKLGRSMGLILLGAIFLAGGWVLNRLRTDLIARAAAAGASQ